MQRSQVVRCPRCAEQELGSIEWRFKSGIRDAFENFVVRGVVIIEDLAALSKLVLQSRPKAVLEISRLALVGDEYARVFADLANTVRLAIETSFENVASLDLAT
jgi:hypothetical protein